MLHLLYFTTLQFLQQSFHGVCDKMLTKNKLLTIARTVDICDHFAKTANNQSYIVWAPTQEPGVYIGDGDRMVAFLLTRWAYGCN